MTRCKLPFMPLLMFASLTAILAGCPDRITPPIPIEVKVDMATTKECLQSDLLWVARNMNAKLPDAEFLYRRAQGLHNGFVTAISDAVRNREDVSEDEIRSLWMPARQEFETFRTYVATLANERAASKSATPTVYTPSAKVPGLVGLDVGATAVVSGVMELIRESKRESNEQRQQIAESIKNYRAESVESLLGR